MVECKLTDLLQTLHQSFFGDFVIRSFGKILCLFFSLIKNTLFIFYTYISLISSKFFERNLKIRAGARCSQVKLVLRVDFAISPKFVNPVKNTFDLHFIIHYFLFDIQIFHCSWIVYCFLSIPAYLPPLCHKSNS